MQLTIPPPFGLIAEKFPRLWLLSIPSMTQPQAVDLLDIPSNLIGNIEITPTIKIIKPVWFQARLDGMGGIGTLQMTELSSIDSIFDDLAFLIGMFPQLASKLKTICR